MKHTLLILLLIPISVWVETADAKPNSTIKGMGIDMGLKVFVESIKKTLPKKIDELTIFTNVEASRSKISHHYKVLASAKEIDVKGLKNFVTNYFVSTICENENSRFLVENVETFSYLYRDSSDALFLSLDFSKNDCVKRIVASSDLKKQPQKVMMPH